MMGAGKTTTGSVLARRLGWPLLDSDAEIVRRRSMTVPEIWRREGESSFRAEESAVLAAAATSSGPVVVAVAGGALLEPANRTLLSATSNVVWLRAPIGVLAHRVGSGAGRPLLDASGSAGEPGAAEVLAALYVERAPLYEAVADLIVDVAGRRPEEVVDAVIDGLGGPAGLGIAPGTGPGA